jgi:hypothetical protein
VSYHTRNGGHPKEQVSVFVVEEAPGSYYIESTAVVAGPRQWTSNGPVYLEDPDTRGAQPRIYGVLVDSQWGGYLAQAVTLLTNSKTTSAFGLLSAPKLPSGQIIGPVRVTRIPGRGNCRGA